jgi:hypothetical protein
MLDPVAFFAAIRYPSGESWVLEENMPRLAPLAIRLSPDNALF